MCQEPDWMQYLCGSLIQGLFIKSTQILWFMFEMCKRTRIILTFFSQGHLPTQFQSSCNIKGWCFSQSKLNAELAKAGPCIDLKRLSPGSARCSTKLDQSIQNQAKGANSQGSCFFLVCNYGEISSPSIDLVTSWSCVETEQNPVLAGAALVRWRAECWAPPSWTSSKPRPAGWRWKFCEASLGVWLLFSFFLLLHKSPGF